MKKLTTADITRNSHLYDKYHQQLLMEDGWFPGNKVDNFYSLIKLSTLTGFSLLGTSCLDVGCGSGDLSFFLKQRGVTEYVGIDIYEPSLQKARQKYPYETFIHGDFLDVALKKHFDFSFCSGALTVKLPSMNNYDFLEAVIRKMWNVTTIGLAFNVLSDEDTHQDPDLFFYSQTKIETICKTIAKQAHIITEKNPTVDQLHVYMY